MAERAESVIPVEVGIDRAAGLLDGAVSLDLAPQACNLQYWRGAVARGTLRGLVNGGHLLELGGARDELPDSGLSAVGRG